MKLESGVSEKYHVEQKNDYLKRLVLPAILVFAAFIVDLIVKTTITLVGGTPASWLENGFITYSYISIVVALLVVCAVELLYQIFSSMVIMYLPIYRAGIYTSGKPVYLTNRTVRILNSMVKRGLGPARYSTKFFIVHSPDIVVVVAIITTLVQIAYRNM